MLYTICFKVSWSKGDLESGVKKFDFRTGIEVKRCWTSGRGSQPTKTSNFPRATAISGLWFVSPN